MQYVFKIIIAAFCVAGLICYSGPAALAETLPTPGSSYNPGTSYGSSTSDRQFRAFFETSVRLTQSLWEGGATSARIAMQKARLAGANHVLADAANSLAFDAVACHIDILRRRDMVFLAKENVTNHESMLAMLKGRVRDGLATVGDVHQVEGRLFRAQGSLEEYLSNLHAVEASFLRITGRNVPHMLSPVSLPSKMYKSPSEASHACQERNPRIKSAILEIEVYDNEKKIAESRYYPQLSAEAGPRWYYQDTKRDKTNHGFDAMLVMRWNLFEGGATDAAKEAANAKKRRAQQIVNQTMDVLAEDIQSTWVRYESAQKQTAYYKQAMNSAKSARIAFYDEYMLGKRSFLDVLDAESDYFAAASQFMVAQGDHAIAAWRLIAMGGDILHELKIDMNSLLQSKPSDVRADNNLTRLSSRQLGRPVVSQEPLLTYTSDDVNISENLRVTGLKAIRVGDMLKCTLVLHNDHGTLIEGEVKVSIQTESGEQLLETVSSTYALRRRVDKSIMATLPFNAGSFPTKMCVRLEGVNNTGAVAFTKIIDITQ